MVVRHRDIEFAGGALVFPGGRVEPDDQALGGADPLDGFRIAGIRETFEECGVLLARRAAAGLIARPDCWGSRRCTGRASPRGSSR